MIYVIGDTQSKPGVKNPLIAVAHHICDLKPKYVIHLGDHWDMPSLSYYDKGKKSSRPLTYHDDIDAGNRTMDEFWTIIAERWPKALDECQFHILKGNHEDRIRKAMEFCDDNMVRTFIDYPPCYDNWEHVHEFLRIVKIEGINFSHYFQNLSSAHPIGTARQLCLKKHTSCIAGHKQGFDYEEMMADDVMIQCMIVGSTYYHPEGYKIQSNHHWRGTVVLYNLDGQGQYDYARYSLDFLDKTKRQQSNQ
ncbi:MAG: hypothetical protein Unbinned1322contig1000_39 [Prokaryotic dsDNA virus sp.]|nr:hypothetical protein [Aequorivita sp.]QDP57295.1 MAG: hypothetical protein Unbinned1322contig1000_39 [Prokaryotic dsDNA virus sp.]|tara:strand:- start:20141 stop:20890 length:750 start_codon:yes stop_codon:yes gene_type:complete